jgi:hypothetical protein
MFTLDFSVSHGKIQRIYRHKHNDIYNYLWIGVSGNYICLFLDKCHGLCDDTSGYVLPGWLWIYRRNSRNHKYFRNYRDVFTVPGRSIFGRRNGYMSRMWNWFLFTCGCFIMYHVYEWGGNGTLQCGRYNFYMSHMFTTVKQLLDR